MNRRVTSGKTSRVRARTDSTSIYCARTLESNTRISAGNARRGWVLWIFDNGDFCLLRFNETQAAMNTCLASSSDASECSDECREAVETYTAAVGCCVYYWRGGVGERSDGRPYARRWRTVSLSARSSFSEGAVLFGLVIAVYELLQGL